MSEALQGPMGFQACCRLPYEVSLDNFTIEWRYNHLQRPVGGVVESGALKNANTVQTNLTNNTTTTDNILLRIRRLLDMGRARRDPSSCTKCGRHSISK